LEQDSVNRVLFEGVLSPKTQTNLRNAKGYFEEHLSVGDYYAENERVQGEWIGEGAALLGLSGRVMRDEFLALCENLHPKSGEQLTQRQNTVRLHGADEVANRRVFYDFTFSPPKSVSIAALVGDDRRIVAAHAEAVKIALTELERFASARVRGGGNNADRRTGNIVAALFEHETSRALDPHLHTHCIIFNATHDRDEGRWKALQNYEMLGAQKYAENVYYHELARALLGFGYDLANSARGDFELTGIAPELRDRFSKRHREIDEKTRAFLAAHPEKRGGNEDAIREHIAHKERARKTGDVGSARLRELWTEQLNGEELASLRQPRKTTPVVDQDLSPAEAVTWAEEHLFERRSVVREHELWRYALETARGGSISVAEIKKETASREYLRGADDKVAHRDVLAREWEIVRVARDGIGRYEPIAASAAKAGEELAPDQRRALEFILRSTNFITLFRGGAGTGKSFVLQRVQRAIDQTHRPSIVLAPQRQQAIDLSRDGLAQTQTVSECLQRGAIPKGAVVIVDEAGQIAGRQLHDLLRLIQERHGRVILSGDTRQHGPVEASDALRAIERYSGLRAAELDQIRRQEPNRGRTVEERKRFRRYRAAVEAAAAGDLPRSFAKLDELGAIIECADDDQSEQLCSAYLEITERKESAIVVSQTRAEVREINNAIRGRLRQRGLLGAAESQVTALEQVDLTAAQKRDARHYPADCVLVFNRDCGGCARGEQGKLVGITANRLALEVAGKVRHVPLKHLDHINVCLSREVSLSPGDQLQLKANATAGDGRKLANGEIVTVAVIKASGAIRLKDGRVLPPHYRQFLRGYAVTSYGSQGKTVDHVLFSDSAVRAASSAQQWYVTISRGRKSVQIFTPDKQELHRAILRSGERELALDLVSNRARRYGVRQQILRSVRHGREFAKRVCRMAMRSWTAAFIKPELKQLHETRNRQTIRPVRPNVLAA
jgi:conjugative relaxase-like TrwC/TraI family protein